MRAGFQPCGGIRVPVGGVVPPCFVKEAWSPNKRHDDRCGREAEGKPEAPMCRAMEFQPCGGITLPQGTWCLRFFYFWRHHGTGHLFRVCLCWSRHQPSDRSGAGTPVTNTQKTACGIPRRPEVFLSRGFRPAGLLRARIKPGNSCGAPYNPARR
jgi:hypothetical protein